MNVALQTILPAHGSNDLVQHFVHLLQRITRGMPKIDLENDAAEQADFFHAQFGSGD
jgi:hypothetical protein